MKPKKTLKNKTTEHFDVIIIGAGAAGLMCAAVAALRGRKVMVLERSNKPGKKILMSGGGRCNFTNLDIQADNYLSANPHFCKSALGQYTQHDFINLVNQYEISWHEKIDGQLFCDDSSKLILNMLLAECDRAGVLQRTNINIESLWFEKEFNLKTNVGVLSAESLVVASGGLSVPTLGGSDLGFKIAKQFGMKVLDYSPGLVPFTLSGDLKEISSAVSGVSIIAKVTTSVPTKSKRNQNDSTQVFTNQLLFTHRGLSGPAILQLSSYWQVGKAIEIDLLPEIELEDFLLSEKNKGSKQQLNTVMATMLPATLVKQLEQRWWPTFIKRGLVEWSDQQLRDVANQFKHWTIKPSGTEGYRTAEVTMGGVDTDGLDSKTMVSKIMPGLFFIGEVVDVTGHLGGYNFQWAWSSAWVAAQAV